MSLYNAEASGSELLEVRTDRNRSTQNLIINEDWCMVMKVLTCENGVVSATKVWDEKDTEGKIFYAVLKYAGKEGVPPDSSIEVGQFVVFHRVGDFNSQGNGLLEFEGFELRTENAEKNSWVCFVETSLTWVYDLGDGTGKEAIFNGAAWTQVGAAYNLVATDPLTAYYTNTPPWCAGRVLLGQKQGDVFVVFLSGLSTTKKIFTFDAGGVTFRLTTDSSGKVTDFSGSAS
uniref:Uncharacterized protein n=1 Tax=viral metagenome TaxID=1070528 RepID=A0A6H1ZEN9_9ZZZZ